MKLADLFAAAMILMVIPARASAADALSSEGRPENNQPSSDTSPRITALRRLAAAIAAGNGAMRAFHGSPSKDAENKDKLDPQIPGLDCYIDRTLNYVSCYVTPIESEDAANILFTRFVDELQAALPAERWQAAKKEPGIKSVRTYVYEDRKSDAHIDVDVVAEPGIDGGHSYIVSIFAWTY